MDLTPESLPDHLFVIIRRPRLQDIFEDAILHPEIRCTTPYIAKIIRVIIANSHQDPFEAQSRHQGPLIKLGCEAPPELAAWIISQEQWCLQGCFEEDHSFPIEPDSYWDSDRFSSFFAYSVGYDPDAIYIRAILHFNFASFDLHYICKSSLEHSYWLTETCGGCWDHGVKARVVACSEAGMDWIGELCLNTIADDRVTLVEFFAFHGSLHILEAAWLELGYDLGSFSADFEGELVCAIVQDLDALRPARKWRQTPRQEIHDILTGIFLDEGYRKFFPDDEEEIEKFSNGFDAVTFSSRYRGYVEDDFDNLPAVNGLTEEFWTDQALT